MLISIYYILVMFSVFIKFSECSYNGLAKNSNILMIFVDDLRHLSDKNCHLDNINNLAGNGISFKNAFAQQALCAPSRNSILTGRRPDALHLYDFYSYWRETVGNFTTIPQFFKERGYATYSVGKVFHPGKSSNFTDDYPYSWTALPYHPSSERYTNAAVCKDDLTNTLQRNLICPVDVDTQPLKTLPDIQSLQYSIKILQNKPNRPFFLAVGFHKPHIPLKFPKFYLKKYPLDEIKSPEFPYKPPGMPTVAWHPWTDVRKRDDIRRLNISFPFGTMPDHWAKKIKQGYFAASSYIDDLIGILMEHVDRKNTIVVLTSDHGWSLGESGLWAKYSNFDVALKVPLIFVVPGLQPRLVHTPVELLDIFPTLAELTVNSDHIPNCKNSNKTLCFDGKSLVPFMYDNNGTLRKQHIAISQYPRPGVYPKKNSDKPILRKIKIMGYSLRTSRFRYTQWIGFNSTDFTRNWTDVYGTELYDHGLEKYESLNLSNITAYKSLIEHLSKILISKVENLQR